MHIAQICITTLLNYIRGTAQICIDRESYDVHVMVDNGFEEENSKVYSTNLHSFLGQVNCAMY
jgi:hypothetical protein